MRLRAIHWHGHALTEPEMRARYAYLCWLEERGVKTAGKQFRSGRKLGKTHQNVLVFVQGRLQTGGGSRAERSAVTRKLTPERRRKRGRPRGPHDWHWAAWAGMTKAEAERHFGCAAGTASYVARRDGIVFQPGRPGRRRELPDMSQADRRTYAKLRRGNISREEALQAIGAVR